MGTRYEDQPVEQWAGPESLDPTPVWKQYLVVAILLVVGLVALVIVAVAALAPEFVTPPALVPGDRLVLAAKDVPSGNVAPVRIGAPLVDDAHAFWIHTEKTGTYAVLTRWSTRPGGSDCVVEPDGVTPVPPGANPGYMARCGDVRYLFAPNGDARAQITMTGAVRTADRGLDRYLVSVSGDRVIVNLSRLIEASERTSGPVPTGIPTPQATTP